MKRLPKLAMMLLGFAVLTISVFSQQPAKLKPSFEVAVIKPNTTGDGRQEIGSQPGGRFVASGMPLKFLMTVAYRMPNYLIFGGPDWIATDRWDIQAKAEEGSVPARPAPSDPNEPDAIALRLQSLLEDRFQLKVRRETRELPVYELVIAKGGAKIVLSPDQTNGPGSLGMRGALGKTTIEGTAIPLANFVSTLKGAVGRPVIDKTDLKGLYDIKLEWPRQPPGAVAPEAGTPDTTVPSIFTVIQEQLGLRLVSSKGPVAVLVIDGVQKPEN